MIESQRHELEVSFPKGQLDTVSASDEANMNQESPQNNVEISMQEV
jgi:hypothetical protein